jgi:hypothetical protein
LGFDPVSTEESAQRLGQLAVKTDAALAAARDAGAASPPVYPPTQRIPHVLGRSGAIVAM